MRGACRGNESPNGGAHRSQLAHEDQCPQPSAVGRRRPRTAAGTMPDPGRRLVNSNPVLSSLARARRERDRDASRRRRRHRDVTEGMTNRRGLGRRRAAQRSCRGWARRRRRRCTISELGSLAPPRARQAPPRGASDEGYRIADTTNRSSGCTRHAALPWHEPPSDSGQAKLFNVLGLSCNAPAGAMSH